MRSVIFLLLSVGFGSLSCQRLEPGQVNITCGRLKDNTAKINYFGDSIRVSAFMRNGKSCAFKQDVAKATWSLDVAFTGMGDKCVMTKMPHRHIYSIEVLSRRGSPVFESDEDEKFLMECNFETYKEEKEESLPLIDVKHPPKVVDTHEGMVSNSNYTVELVGMEGQKLKSAEVGLIVRLKVTMSPSKEEKDLGFMPVRCDVVTPDERQSSAILADGCGTGFPFDRKKGFQMIKMVGVSPPFRVFRLHPKKSVGFKCSFVTCKEDCIGSTCEVEDSNLPRLKRDAEPPKFVHATTGDTEIEGSDLNPQELISFSLPLEISKSVLDWESKHNTETSPEFSMDTFRKLHTWNAQIPRTNLIILTYMRSGSTLTGGMFDQHPDVFYVFEPIHSLKWIWRSRFKLLSYFDRPSRRITSSDSFAELAIDIADAFLRCRPDKIDIATLNQDHFNYSKNTKPYLECLKVNPGVLGMLNCLSILQNQCSQSNVSVVKTIRLQMEAVETMMKSNPSLKVVHLVRDPRPTIRSQMGVNSSWSNLDSYSKIHCLGVQKDLEVTKRLMKSHPGRTKLLLYEDLVSYPAKTVKDLFSFVGLVYTRDTEIFVQSKTNSSTGEPCQVCIREGNSTSISLQWRQQFDFEKTRIIDANCKPVYQMLGYLPANSRNELVDLSMSLKIDREF